MIDRIKLLNENQKVLDFIKSWQGKNNYNPIALDEYNAKFSVEFNHFLTTSNLSKETIQLFKS